MPVKSFDPLKRGNFLRFFDFLLKLAKLAVWGTETSMRISKSPKRIAYPNGEFIFAFISAICFNEKKEMLKINRAHKKTWSFQFLPY